jgi:trk system potassium uptake protein
MAIVWGSGRVRTHTPRQLRTLSAVHVVIMGCGRVGSTLAETLDAQGATIAVIDQENAAFRRLPPTFGGRTVTGVGFDREVLVEAGIERASAFAAVSSGDNSNIVAARVARETFGVENVVARIYDPRRAEVYQRLGISTVATVRWTADQMMRRIRPAGAESEWTDASGTVRLAEVHVSPAWIGQLLTRIETLTPARVAFLTRLGEGMIPGPDTVLQEGDLLHVLSRATDMDAIGDILDQAPPHEEH